ncbi:MAG: translation initiation factor IF-2 subunit beta [Candidatus Aenigmarchaeota archaeon]|nr:translation initiation factor IF-2 subunit beta [Candidatus Aenigmarchaeota archaeon]MCX8190638.1 translation initiation factor IF-2 subunit beta [Candidatus Aenigmarchaeota archaeon]MDW8159806.1 translation initiation factor IF-2 subunit beta [Candidatus Aenigmarchaeota archaeon]
MKYEELLDEAFKKITKKESGDRFSPPQPEIEIEGEKTLVKNFLKIAEYIKRDPKHFSKYLMKSLASSGEINNGVLVFFSKLKREQITNRIEAYIKSYVICKFCKEPDTKLEKKDRIYIIKCEACGATYGAEG